MLRTRDNTSKLVIFSGINDIIQGLASFPGLTRFWSSVCVQYNTRKWKSGEKQGRPGNTYHVNNVKWMRGGRGGGGVHNQIMY